MPPAGGIFICEESWCGMAASTSLPYNPGMTQLDLLLPFGLPPQEMARDLLRELKTPALAMLLARANRTENQVFDGFARALPHEIWLAQQFGLRSPVGTDSSPALAASVMQRFGMTAAAGTWFIVQPVHLHIARDHLVLTDPRQLRLSEQDAHDLFDIVKPLFEESGMTLSYGDAQTWFLRSDDWQTLLTSTPDAACGHNIDIWMPKGPPERDWRRLQNEIQMHWHDHTVNDRREMAGLKPVNSVWLWGGAEAAMQASGQKFDATFTLPESDNPFSKLGSKNVTVNSVTDIMQTKPQHGLLVLDQLIASAMTSDWSEWLGIFQQLEANWIAPLLDAVKNGRLEQLSVTVSHNTALASYAVSKSSLRKFWLKPSLSRLSK
ncbi:MAG TPA: hypothetical protein VGO72_08410 [Herminiimonas sp.]|nr:hypothetical protein [Herminiimonas sp.]